MSNSEIHASNSCYIFFLIITTIFYSLNEQGYPHDR